jgi:DNA helicase-2/ATP-dependent DNA helicase PcrA
VVPALVFHVVYTPTRSQREAIEAEPAPLLVVAGPGSGKTFCLIERIRFLIEEHDVAPERICAFTFTNKAAEEIATRLDQVENAALVKRTTIHKFCVDLLREHGRHIGIEPGFGIADDEYQMQVLWRLEANPAKRNALPKYFSLFRLRGDELRPEAARRLEQYEAILRKQNLLDFDMLVLRARDLMLHVDDVANAVRARWAAVLVDEFQDLNPVQYAVLRALTREHNNVFAVGDYDQSIYGWAGAQPELFQTYMNDFGIIKSIDLLENRRCPRHIFDLARRFVETNPMLPGLLRPELTAQKPAVHDIETCGFESADDEIEWIIRDIHRQREDFGLSWGDFALLYRKHEIGNVAEPSLLGAGIPCRLAHGRAIAEDPVVRYVAAALRIIAEPNDDIHKETFLGLVLPKTLRDVVKAEAEANCEAPIDRLRRMSRTLGPDDEEGKKLRRAFYALRNFGALGRRHASVGSLIDELLSNRVGEYRTPLERQHQLISDPETVLDARTLAFRLESAISHDRPVSIPHMDGAEIPVKAILHGIGVRTVRVGLQIPRFTRDAEQGVIPRSVATRDLQFEQLGHADAPSVGLPLAIFKAGQILASRRFAETFRDYTAIDLETTGKDSATCHVVEIAAVRVRRGQAVAEFSSLVRPTIPIPPDATRTHGISNEDVANAPAFADIWPKFREFCGNDIVVAHNGYNYDYKVLHRLAGTLHGLGTYDTIPLARELVPESRSLEHLAAKYGIDVGQSHRALPDAHALAKVFLRLNEAKLALSRKTSLVHLLDHLGVALALTQPHEETSEAKLLLDLARPYALGGFSECLEYYRIIREQLGDASRPTIDNVIEALGGQQRMNRIRAQRSADERYPVAMERLRRLLANIGRVGVIPSEARDLQSDDDLQIPPSGRNDGLIAQISTFLERVALSVTEGQAADRDRVNLLTLHSTKGLEFSRVYIVGVEDAQFTPGERPSKQEIEEARRVLYVGMTRAKDRLVLTRAEHRNGRPTGGTQFLDQMKLTPRKPPLHDLVLLHGDAVRRPDSSLHI